jgi:3-oxoacyl-[acyl-carrier protein] reductase
MGVLEGKAAGRRAVAQRADQGGTADLRRLVDAALERFGGLDVLVVNAAANPPPAPAEVTEEQFDRVFAINTKGPYLLMRHAAAALRDGGRIIGVSTLSTRLHAPDSGRPYPAGKAALEQITVAMALALGGRGITVNCVSPGPTDTQLLRSANPGACFPGAVAATALGRLGLPQGIARVVGFLAGPDAQWVTGQNPAATGGLHR